MPPPPPPPLHITNKDTWHIAQISIHLSSCLNIDLLAHSASQHLDCPCLQAALLHRSHWRFENAAYSTLTWKKIHVMQVHYDLWEYCRHRKQRDQSEQVQTHLWIHSQSWINSWWINVLKGLWHEMKSVFRWKHMLSITFSKHKIPKTFKGVGLDMQRISR